MWRPMAYLPLLILIVWLFPGHAVSQALAVNSYVAVINIDRTIDPISARHLGRGIDKATADGAQLVIIKLNTPGGLLSSTREMVAAILEAKIAVAVYVSPSGAQAASAGTFLTAAANFAVMSPGTNIGAASPVAAGGEDIPTTMAKKINEDTTAFIRSIAETRGRDAAALEETVTKARSYSAREAVQSNVVDFIASDLTDLLSELDGRTVRTAAGTVILQTKDVSVQEIKLTLLESFLSVLANPNLAFLLLVLGGLALTVEMLTPGLIGPGVVGVIALALSFIGMGHLPVNWMGVGLILFSLVLLFFELAQPGLGIFGGGAVISLVLGALLLFGGFFSTPEIAEPSFRVSLWVIGIFAGMLVLFLSSFLYLARTTGDQSAYVSGSESALVGQQGLAVSDLEPSGMVSIANEEWTATTDVGSRIRKGEEVAVIGVYGSVLKVTKHTRQAKRKRKAWYSVFKPIRRQVSGQ